MGQVTPASRRMRWRREVATNNDLSASHLLVTPALTHIIVLSKFIRHSERLFMWTACRVESACYRRVSGDHLTALTQRQLHRWLLWIERHARRWYIVHMCVSVWHQCCSSVVNCGQWRSRNNQDTLTENADFRDWQRDFKTLRFYLVTWSTCTWQRNTGWRHHQYEWLDENMTRRKYKTT